MGNDPPASHPAPTQQNPSSPRPHLADDLVVMVDSRWRVKAAAAGNPDHAKVVNPLVGKTLFTAIPELVGTSVQTHLLDAMSSRTPAQFDSPYAPLNAWLEVRAWPTGDGGLAIFCQDVSESRAQRQRADSAAAAKDRFLAVLSHELRTPLTPVLIAAGALEKDVTLSQTARQELASIRRNIELEARLIDDLLDLNRIVSGKLNLNLKPADLHRIIGHALLVSREEILSHRTWLRIELNASSHFVHADSLRLQQVFWNLLQNAVKFSHTGGTVTVRSSNHPASTNPSTTIIRVEIADTGIGIEPDALLRIFDAFEQAGARASAYREPGGLGLGLAICKALVELHHGHIHAESAGVGRGATLIVELPTTAEIPVVSNLDLSSAASSPARGVNILIVEDHTSTAHALTRLLASIGHTVTIAANIQQALALASHHPFDLLISDLGLPDGSGLDLLRTLRQNHPSLRALALSGFGMEDDLRQSAQAGFAVHLVKPVTVEQLRAAIASAISSNP